jgi:hypothetical protein
MSQFSEAAAAKDATFAGGRRLTGREIAGFCVARRVLPTGIVRRFLLAIAFTTVVAFGLGLGAGVAAGQPAKPAGAAVQQATDAAQTELATAVRERAAKLASKAALAKRHAAELAEVDRVTKQKASWRKQAQLDKAKGKALETGKALTAIDAELRAIDKRIATARTALVAAIDVELALLPDGARKRALVATRAGNVAAPAAAVKKIVVPDGAIDPLADPEELDQQAQDLRASETELLRQVEALDSQAKRLARAAELRKAHERAGDLAIRDDEQIRRGGGTTSTGGRDGVLAADDDAGGSPAPEDPMGPPPNMDGFQGEATAQILADVIDPATGDALRRAGRATDPATKAAAAKRARDQVAAPVEARAKQLRRK